MIFNPVLVVARFTLLEAARTRLPWIVLAVITSGLLLGEGAAALALTDSHSYRVDIYAAWTRVALVACTSLFVATSVVRELSERAIDLTLSRPLSRSAWFLGRLLGFSAAVAVLALLATLPLLCSSAPMAALAWGYSFAAELSLIAAATLSCAVALSQVTASVLAVAAFYLLARVISAMVLMSHGPTVIADAWSSVVIGHLVSGLALLLPGLDDYTRVDWLDDASAAVTAMPAITVQTLIYVVLLAAMGLFDFMRREI